MRPLRSTTDAAASHAGAPAERLFAGAGEMRALCRAKDWGTTPLGSVSGWSQSLRSLAATILASRHPMFLWWGPELVQLYNDAYRASLGEGGRHPRALGMRGIDFWTDIWEIIFPQIQGVMHCGEATWHEDQLVPIIRNGQLEEVYWTYSYSPAFDDDGSIGGTLVTCQETTRRVVGQREIERMNHALEIERARLSDVFRNALGFAAVLRGPEHRFELANDAYYRVVGHRELIGRTVREAMPEMEAQGFPELLDQVLRTGRPVVGHEVPVHVVRVPGGLPEERFVDFVYEALVEVDGTRSGVVAHGSDVTDHVHARREVERLLAESEHARRVLAEREAERDRLIVEANAARAEAEDANRAKDDFLALVSHELRSPLAGIASNVQLLDMGMCGPLSVRQQRAMDRITRSQQHLRALIDQLLDLKKMEAGKMLYDIAPVCVREALADAAEHVGAQLDVRRVTVGWADDTPGSDAPRVSADPEKLRQILINLLTNAAKFTAEGGHVTLGWRREGTGVLLEVGDDGIGIPDDQMEAVFEPFVQVRDGRQPVITGTGLGLAISRDLARGMGGNITVRSVVGAGSTFTVELPAA